MARIAAGQPLVTLINVFTVEPTNQQALVDLLVEATKTTMQQVAGFVSATIHKSKDGKRVVNYAQWQTVEAFEAMRKNPEAKAHMDRAAALATFDPILCDVADSIGGEGD